MSIMYSTMMTTILMSMMMVLSLPHTVHGQSTNTSDDDGISLGMLSSLAHNVAGEVVILSTRVIEIRNFIYDGAAPAVYFWADTNVVPSTNVRVSTKNTLYMSTFEIFKQHKTKRIFKM